MANREPYTYHIEIPNDWDFAELQFGFNPNTTQVTFNAQKIYDVAAFNHIDINYLTVHNCIEIIFNWYLHHLAHGGLQDAEMESFIAFRKQSFSKSYLENIQ